jgi:hypothetical protein
MTSRRGLLKVESALHNFYEKRTRFYDYKTTARPKKS